MLYSQSRVQHDTAQQRTAQQGTPEHSRAARRLLLLQCDDDHGEGEDERLAGPREGDANHVAALQGSGEALDLKQAQHSESVQNTQ